MVEYDALWTDISVQHLDTFVQKLESLAQLHEPVLDLDVEHLVVPDQDCRLQTLPKTNLFEEIAEKCPVAGL